MNGLKRREDLFQEEVEEQGRKLQDSEQRLTDITLRENDLQGRETVFQKQEQT